MPSMPSLMTEHDLSIAELHAAKLDGLVLPVGNGFRFIDRPDGQAERSAALAGHVPERMIVVEESAAWVWGGIVEAPEPIRLSSQPRHRARLPPSADRVTRELAIDSHELVSIPVPDRVPLMVTNPLRTAIDLARSATRLSAAAALRGLLATGAVTADQVRGALQEHPGRAGTAAALAAVGRAAPADQPLLTR